MLSDTGSIDYGSYMRMVAERDRAILKAESLLLRIHGDDHTGPFASCEACAAIMAEEPHDE